MEIFAIKFQPLFPLSFQYKPWFLMVYGITACWFLLGTNGLVLIFLHVTAAYLVAQFKNPILTWMSSLLLLSTLHLPALEEIKVSSFLNFLTKKNISILILKIFVFGAVIVVPDAFKMNSSSWELDIVAFPQCPLCVFPQTQVHLRTRCTILSLYMLPPVDLYPHCTK